MAFSQHAARPLFSRTKGQTPPGVAMRQQVRTGLRPSPPPSIAVSPTPENEQPIAQTPTLGAPQTGKAQTTVARAPQPGGEKRPSTMTYGGETRTLTPTPPRDPSMNSGGTITMGGVKRAYAPTPVGTRPTATGFGPVPTGALPTTPTTAAAPQTESNNPLSGDTNKAPEEETTSINPAQAAGFSARGATTPAGSDAVGGTGLFQRRFSSPQAAGIYDQYVRRLFGNEPGIA